MKRPGKQEIQVWFDAYLARAGNLVKIEDLTPDKVFLLMGSQIGWYWDVDEFGIKDGSPLGALYAFLQTLIDSKKGS